VLADDTMRDEVAAVGAGYIPWRRAPNRADRLPASDFLRDWEVADMAKFVRLLDRVTIGPAGAYAADTADELRRHPADVLICSELLFGPMVAAQATCTKFASFASNIACFTPIEGVPPIGPGLTPPATEAEHAQARAVWQTIEGMMAEQTPMLNTVRAGFGLPPLNNALAQMSFADLQLHAISRAFDFPSERLPETIRYVGSMLDTPSWAGGWTPPWPANDPRPLVLVAMSTTFQDQTDAIQRVLNGLASTHARVLVTLGPALAGAAVSVPDNAVVVAGAPHDLVMREAVLVVSHCGHGTVARALAHGLPLLCLPMGRDQNDNAARVAARGAGIRLSADATAAEIGRAARTLLDDPTYTTAAREVGAAMAAADSEVSLVEELELLAAREKHRKAA
jgi:UDP:flavonoid glycosyltransferase YjiC (YdhE family)